MPNRPGGNARGVAWHHVRGLVQELDWQLRAVCGAPEVNSDLFNSIEVRPGRSTYLRLAEAQTHCRPCPVRAECLAWGRRERNSGVYGGEMLADGQIRDLSKLAKARVPSKKKVS